MPEQTPKPTDGVDPDRISDIDRQITENLRKLYRATVEEDLPASLRALLERLKAQDTGND